VNLWIREKGPILQTGLDLLREFAQTPRPFSPSSRLGKRMAGHVAPVPRHSPEFDRYEYLLQLSCRSTTARDINVWSVSNSHLTAQFERRAQSQLAVDCWVDVTALDDANSIQDVCKRGFSMPVTGEGIAFTTGTIKFDADAPDQRQYLLCSVSIGRSFVVDDLAAKRELPAGFDSLYLHMPEGDGAGDLYRHTYVVFDPAQILPRCVVHFTFNPLDRPPRRPPSAVNLAEVRQRVVEALAVLGPAAGAATEKMLMDIGAFVQLPPAPASARSPAPGACFLPLTHAPTLCRRVLRISHCSVAGGGSHA
jgi:hypothetical protein